MPARYRTLFQTPGTIPLTAAGLLARMPLSMIGIGLITMVATESGSYTYAGGIAAVFAVSSAVAAPQIARLIDRFGQRRVVPWAVLISSLALATLLLSFRREGSEAVVFIAAAFAGIMPAAAALVRVRWVRLLRRTGEGDQSEGARDSAPDPRVHTAFAWEAVLDDVSFVVGPPISIALTVGWFPEAGPLVGGALLIVGMGWLLAQRATEPQPGQHTVSRGPLAVLRSRAVWGVLVVMVAMGSILGTMDVASVAFADRQGVPGAASIVLVIYAGGSVLAGLIFGAFSPKRTIRSLLRWAMAGAALTTLPLLWVGSIWELSLAVFVAGIFVAPTMILGTQLIESSVPAPALTEALSWSNAGLGFGVAIGPGIAGPLIDLWGASGGFAISIAGAALMLLLIPIVTRADRTLPTHPSP